MNNLVTILLTVFITAGVILGAGALFGGGGDLFGNGSFFGEGTPDSLNDSLFDDDGSEEEGGDEEPGEVELEETEDGTAAVATCGDNEIALEDPITGEISCETAEDMETECLGLDGEAHAPGTTFTYNVSATSTPENPVDSCDTIDFTCTEGVFTSGSGKSLVDSLEVREDCLIIDLSDEDEVFCEYEGTYFTEGDVIYGYAEEQVPQTQDCTYVGFFCQPDTQAEPDEDGVTLGMRYSSFTESDYPFNNCSFTDTMDEDYLVENAEELLDEGKMLEDDDGNLIPNPNYEPEVSGKSCTTPWGDSYESGESALSFREPVVLFDEECVVRTSECDDGEWIEREPFDHPTCKPRLPNHCYVKNTAGVDVLFLSHDQRGRYYGNGSYNGGVRSCEEQEVHCWDGELSPEGYTQTSCVEPVQSAPAPAPKPYNAAQAVCPNPYVDGGPSWKADQTGIGYNVSSVGYGSTCNPQVANLVCKFGSIRIGNTSSYSDPVGKKYYRTCVEGTPNGCVFDFLDISDANLDHGGTKQHYSVNKVSYGDSCSNYVATTYCDNGSLTIGQGRANCVEPDPAPCSHACQGSIPHGSSITTYAKSSYPHGPASCSQVANSIVVSSCDNGTLSPAPSSHCSCTIDAPANCSNGMSHGETITRHNDPGCSDSQQGNSLDGAVNSACQCSFGSVTCTNGVLSQTPNYPGDSYPVGGC